MVRNAAVNVNCPYELLVPFSRPFDKMRESVRHGTTAGEKYDQAGIVDVLIFFSVCCCCFCGFFLLLLFCGGGVSMVSGMCTYSLSRHNDPHSTLKLHRCAVCMLPLRWKLRGLSWCKKPREPRGNSLFPSWRPQPTHMQTPGTPWWESSSLLAEVTGHSVLFSSKDPILGRCNQTKYHLKYVLSEFKIKIKSNPKIVRSGLCTAFL